MAIPFVNFIQRKKMNNLDRLIAAIQCPEWK